MIAGAFVALFTCSALAQDYMILDRRADEFDRWQERMDATYGSPIIAREFDVPVTVLEEQRSRTQFGYGGLMIANELARETGRGFDEIVALKQSGMGWGRIAQENGVKLGPIVSRFDRVDTAFRGYGNAKRDEMKSGKFVNGHDGRDGRWDKPNAGSARGKSGQGDGLTRGKPAKAHGGGKRHGGGKGKK